MNIKYLASAGLTILIAGIAVIVLAVGGGSAKTRQPQTAAAGTAVSVRSTSLGKTLVDAQGRTLYLFEADKANVSTRGQRLNEFGAPLVRPQRHPATP
jgi:predicted lipoprotein with Yx(FWY)xxD motif